MSYEQQGTGYDSGASGYELQGRKRLYSGRCIGGPLDGKHRASEYSYFQIVVPDHLIWALEGDTPAGLTYYDVGYRWDHDKECWNVADQS